MGDEDDGSEGVAAAAAAAAAAQAAAAAAAATTAATAAADAVCPRMQSPSRPEPCECASKPADEGTRRQRHRRPW